MFDKKCLSKYLYLNYEGKSNNCYFCIDLFSKFEQFLKQVIKNPINKDISTINIAIADDLWDYFSRFSVNN